MPPSPPASPSPHGFLSQNFSMHHVHPIFPVSCLPDFSPREFRQSQGLFSGIRRAFSAGPNVIQLENKKRACSSQAPFFSTRICCYKNFLKKLFNRSRPLPASVQNALRTVKNRLLTDIFCVHHAQKLHTGRSCGFRNPHDMIKKFFLYICFERNQGISESVPGFWRGLLVYRVD